MRFLALFLALTLLACSGANESEPAAETHDDAMAQTEVEAEAQPEMQAVQYAVGDKVELTGVAGCGHCSYHVTESCSMAMTVGDVVYILDGIQEDTEAFNQRSSGKEISVVGVLTDAGDPKHIQVESHQI